MAWYTAKFKVALPPYRYSRRMETAAVVFLLVLGLLGGAFDALMSITALVGGMPLATPLLLTVLPISILACFYPKFGAVWLTLDSLLIVPQFSIMLYWALTNSLGGDFGFSDYFMTLAPLLALTGAAWYLRRLRELKAAASPPVPGGAPRAGGSAAELTWRQGLPFLALVAVLLSLRQFFGRGGTLPFLLLFGAGLAGLFAFFKEKGARSAGARVSEELGGAAAGMGAGILAVLFCQSADVLVSRWAIGIGAAAGYAVGALIGRMFRKF
ncbi:MAG TPA: hypothetical protein VNH15_07140 [Elusimicrobiota bacterium]|nr:hypothetical protein [Elusimicrobiota bacterium]